MALSVRLDPVLEERLSHEARRLKVSKSQYVIDMLERALAPQDPHALLLKIRAQYGLDAPVGAPKTRRSENVKTLVRTAIEEKHRGRRAG